MFNNKLISKNELRFYQETEISNFITNNIISNIDDIQNVPLKSLLNISSRNIHIIDSLNQRNINTESVNDICSTPLNQMIRYDAITSLNIMHKIHPMRNFLTMIGDKLESDGIFFGTLYGSDNLIQICNSFYKSYEFHKMSFINHFLPVVSMKSIASLMQSSGFKNIVINLEKYPIKYENIYHCLHEIRQTGGSNVLNNRLPQSINRNILKTANKIFLSEYDGICDYIILFLFAQKA